MLRWPEPHCNDSVCTEQVVVVHAMACAHGSHSPRESALASRCLWRLSAAPSSSLTSLHGVTGI
jgi:hypothetical protein